MSARFFSDKLCRDGEDVRVTGADVHHIRDVLRLKRGDRICVCDASATDYELEILECRKDEILTRVLDSHKNNHEARCRYELFQAVPRGDKMDRLIQQSVEYGVSRIVPFYSEHGQIRLEAAKEQKRIERWQRIAEAAAKQCGRGRIPLVAPFIEFPALLTELQASDLSFVAWESERRRSLAEFLHEEGTLRADAKISFAIGAEGGFSDREIERIHEAGIATLSLGALILRSESAAPFVLAVLQGGGLLQISESCSETRGIV